MENKTGFDLNAALRQWSDELAGQPGLTPETRNELETHLRDTMEDLCGRGISAEESFWLARKRIGPPRQLGGEFAKIDPSAVWKMRALTIAAALLAVHLIQGALAGVSGSLTFAQLHHWVQAAPITVRVSTNQRREGVPQPIAIAYAMQGLPWWLDGLRDGLQEAGVGDAIGAAGVIGLGVVIVRWPTGRTARLWRLLFKSKGRFLMIGTASVLLVYGVGLWRDGLSRSVLAVDPSAFPVSGGVDALSDALSKLVFPLALVVLIAWLVPGEGTGKRLSIGSRASA